MGYHKALKNGKWGYIENSLKPKELFDFHFRHKSDLGIFIDGFAEVVENDTHKIIITKGEVIYSSSNCLYNLGNGLILVGQESKYELVDVKKLNS